MSEGIYKYGKDVIWSLPCLFQYEIVYGAIYRAFEAANIKLPKVNLFGAPQTLWTGGRVPTVYGKFDKTTLSKLLNYTCALNASPTFTFTCTELKKEDLYDPYTNEFLETAFEFDSRFIVASDLLRDYIKEKNPNATVIASVINAHHRFQGKDKIEDPTPENETEYYNKLLKEYDIVVVRPEYSKGVLVKDPTLIDDLSRIEVLINQTCAWDCPKAPDHHRYMEAFRLKETVDPQVIGTFHCYRKELGDINVLKKTVLHTKDDVDILTKAGVKHLKLQGRNEGNPMRAFMLKTFCSMFELTNPLGYCVAQSTPEYLKNEGYIFSNLLADCSTIYSIF